MGLGGDAMKRLLACLLGLASAVQGTAPPDAQARFLAGLPVETTELEPFAREAAWQQHAAASHRVWIDVEDRQLAPLHAWMAAVHPEAYRDPAPLFYLFSGPDFLYANAFFPEASDYILCGREPVGGLPNVAALAPDARAAALAGLRTALNASLSYSFFITADMKKDLVSTELSGTLPVLYFFLARTGCRIHEATLVQLGADGQLTSGKSKTPGVKITFTGPLGRPQTLWYFTTDLSDWGAKANPAFLAFCRRQGQGNALVKAASYLMHLDSFSTARQFLLGNVRHLVQDDSGIPFRHFKPERWTLHLHGNYPGPIEIFQQHFQADLDAAFRNASSGPLPFGFGYQWRPPVSSLIFARSTPSIPRAIPVDEE
jgi:hypothetical protein